MPMRLLIASVLTAMIIPVFYGAYEDLSIARTEDGLLSEIDDFMMMSRALLDGGVGSSAEFDFQVESRMNSGPVKVSIGGPIDGDDRWTSFTVGYSISGGGLRYIVSRPPIQITSGSQEAVVLGEGDHTLILEHSVMNGTHLILIRR